jgi:hypothetical protein
VSTTIPGNLGAFIATKQERKGRHSAVPTHFGTVYIPPDGAGEACFVVRVRLPLAAHDCRFGADEIVRLEFVERNSEWQYTPEGQGSDDDTAAAYARLEKTLDNSDVGDVSSLDVLEAAEAYAEARAKEAVAKCRGEGEHT